MAYVLEFLALADGTRDEHCGRYLFFYSAEPHLLNGEYDGGRFITTDSLLDAQKFDTPTDAIEAWKTPATCACHGIRPDGKPNRPLTKYTVTALAIQIKPH